MIKLKYLIPSAVLTALGLFFRFALIGYKFLAYFLFLTAFVFIGLWVLDILKQRNVKGAKALKKVFVLGFSLFFAVFLVTEAFIIANGGKDKKIEADWAVVLGCGIMGKTPSKALKTRLEAALEFAEEYPEAKIVLSGGQGPGEDITEAECMYRWLTACGVEKERLYLEDTSTSTFENLSNSKELILENDPGFSGDICIITEGYHAMRACSMAEHMGLSPKRFTKDLDWPFLMISGYIREAFAVWYYWIF